jgi:PAS domain S-box-containing protein
VEDVPADAELYLRVLQEAGYEVAADVVSTREEFSRKLESGSYDVVLSDHLMPGWSGTDALEALKRSTKDIPFLLVTGTIGEEAAAECIKQGAADYILKDRPTRLPTAIRRALEEKALREERARMEEDLRASEERLRLAQEVAKIGSFERNFQTGESRWTPEMEAIYGLPPGGFPKSIEAFLDLVHGQDRPYVERLLEQLNRTGDAEGEWRVLWPDGTVHWITGRWKVFKDENGRPLRMVGIDFDITERRQAQNQMADALRYTQKILDTSPVGIITYKASGEAVGANPASAQLVGASIEQLMAQSFRHMESWRRSGLLALAEEALASGAPRYGEARMTSTFGTELWLNARLVPFTYEDEPHLLALFEDIAERKRAEEALKLFRVLVDQSNDAIQVVDLETMRLFDVNERACSSLGYTREELLSMSVHDIDPTVDEFVHVKVNNELRKSGFVMLETLQRRKDGSTFPVEISMKYVQLDRGYVVCAIRDITERKQAEEKLRQSEEKFSIAFRSSPLAVTISTLAEERYVDANEAFLRIVDRYREQVIGRTATELNVWAHPEDRTKMVQELQRTGRGSALEAVFNSLSAGPRDVKVFGELVQLEGTPCVVAVTEDVTDAKRMEHRYRLFQKLEATGRLAGGIAHDFNNVLNVILGYCGLLLERFGAADPSRKQVEQIEMAARQATELTRQLLAFSRQQVLQAKALNLNNIISDMSDMLRRLIGEDIEFTASLADSLWPIKADPTQMAQIVMNLVVNARDAMPSGGKVTIETANVKLNGEYIQTHVQVTPGDYVRLVVTDTGVGMDEDTKARIFEPFFTTKELGKGTGLGLATVYGIVKQSGGFIWVYSEPGDGTAFKIYFPRSEAPVVEDVAARASIGDSHGDETILVLEDNGQLRELAVEFLESTGYSVLEAGDSEKALEIARTHEGPIHLLMTDVVLPKMSGRVVAEKLTELHPATKVLFVSGYTDDVIVRHGILNEGVAFLEKPYTRESLTSKIRTMLDHEPHRG